MGSHAGMTCSGAMDDDAQFALGHRARTNSWVYPLGWLMFHFGDDVWHHIGTPS